MMDALTLARCTGSTTARAAPYAETLTKSMAAWQIDTSERIAAFLANVTVETQYLRAVEENLNYTTAARLREIFPSLFVAAKGGRYVAEEYTRNPAGLSKIKYAGYHGRGHMHLTWLEAYQAASDALGFDYVGNPALVMVPEHAAETACWFWTKYKNINPVADRGDMSQVRLLVNGKARLSLAETIAQRAIVLDVLKAG